jgi:5-dehydro-2-deoxygluconokinase
LQRARFAIPAAGQRFLLATASGMRAATVRDMRAMYMLPFDHRDSFEHGLFGWSGALTSEQTAQVAAVKRVVYDALLRALDEGVPVDHAEVLVDEQFGHEVLADARSRGIASACPAEKSGQAEFQFEYGEDFARHIEAMAPTYTKVLVRYNPQGDAALNRRQAARLHRLSEYLHQTQRGFLFELLVPAEPDQLARMSQDEYDRALRPTLAAAAMRELQDAGIEPDIWKVEGLDRREDAIAIAETARRGGRDHVVCIVLGRHADDARVQHWLEVAASVPAFIGFAVGRSTFWEPLEDLIAGRIARADAAAAIAHHYRRWVDVWEAARGERPRDLEVFADGDTLAHAEAERIVAQARTAIAARDRFSIALSGGSTPRTLYSLLATPRFASQIDWSRVHVFWGDERCVPPEHPESNFRMTREALLDRVPIPWGNVHRIAGEDEPEAAARAYEQALRAFLDVPDGPPERTFDLVLLGMGEDGHTASLFPGTPAVEEDRRWAVPNRGPHGMWRITLTQIVLDAADAITFLVAGAAKAERLHEVLEEPPQSPPLPAQLIHPTHGALTWMIDAAAARKLQRAT